MANYEIKRRASIGSSSLILIFIVLCLATFGILSLGNARREDALSEKNADAVKAYYQADSQAEGFVEMVDRALCQGGKKQQVLDGLGAYYQADTDTVCTDIPMTAGQALRVELAVDWNAWTYSVLKWNVYEKETYEIDQSVPIWTGNSMEENPV